MSQEMTISIIILFKEIASILVTVRFFCRFLYRAKTRGREGKCLILKLGINLYYIYVLSLWGDQETCGQIISRLLKLLSAKNNI